jgi:hypothetical protein
VPLRLGSIGDAVERMVEVLAAEDRSQWVERARRLLHDADPGELKAKLRDAEHVYLGRWPSL